MLDLLKNSIFLKLSVSEYLVVLKTNSTKISEKEEEEEQKISNTVFYMTRTEFELGYIGTPVCYSSY